MSFVTLFVVLKNVFELSSKPMLAVGDAPVSVTTSAELDTSVMTTPLLLNDWRKIETVSSGVKEATSLLSTGTMLSGVGDGVPLLPIIAYCARPNCQALLPTWLFTSNVPGGWPGIGLVKSCSELNVYSYAESAGWVVIAVSVIVAPAWTCWYAGGAIAYATLARQRPAATQPGWDAAAAAVWRRRGRGGPGRKAR